MGLVLVKAPTGTVLIFSLPLCAFLNIVLRDLRRQWSHQDGKSGTGGTTYETGLPPLLLDELAPLRERNEPSTFLNVSILSHISKLSGFYPNNIMTSLMMAMRLFELCSGRMRQLIIHCLEWPSLPTIQLLAGFTMKDHTEYMKRKT